MPSAEVNGTDLHYEVVGEGPTCLVVHGWPGTDHTYLRPSLDRLGSRLRLVYYDQRGHGRSGRPSVETLSMEQLADEAAALAAELSRGPVLVLGHFHGASVAQQLAIRHPDRVAALVLVAATPGELGAGESLLDDLADLDATPTPPEVEILQRVPPGSDAELASTMAALAGHFFDPWDPERAERVFARTTFDAATAVGLTPTLSRWSAVDRLGEVEAPILLITGRHDVFAPPAQARRIERRAPAASLVVLERSGHLPWLDEPEPFAAAVERWLDATATKRSAGDGSPPR
jgi:proline iminopeptidase